MSNSDKKLWIIENLPSGGAKEMLNSNAIYLAKYFQVEVIKEPKKLNYDNFFKYLFKLYFQDDSWEKLMAQKIDKKDICLFYHSKYTKSPNLMSHVSTRKSMYICQEGLREYIDTEHVKIQTMKERIINLLRRTLISNDKRNVSKTKIIVANSKFSKKILSKQYKKPIKVVYPGINTKKFITNIKSPLKSITAINLLTVGTVNKFKRHHFLISVAGLLSENSKVNFTIIGNGIDCTYSRKLESMASKFTNLNLNILINVNEKKKIEAYRKADLFIYAPVSEPFGIVVLEALASGLPIVTYKYGGGYNEVIYQSNGLIIDNLRPEMWKSKIENLINNKFRMAVIQKFNRKYSRKFDEIHMNKSLLSLINNL